MPRVRRVYEGLVPLSAALSAQLKMPAGCRTEGLSYPAGRLSKSCADQSRLRTLIENKYTARAPIVRQDTVPEVKLRRQNCRRNGFGAATANLSVLGQEFATFAQICSFNGIGFTRCGFNSLKTKSLCVCIPAIHLQESFPIHLPKYARLKTGGVMSFEGTRSFRSHGGL